jgi:hypothetical protein
MNQGSSLWVCASAVAFVLLTACGSTNKTDVQDPSKTDPTGTGATNATNDPSSTPTNPGDTTAAPASSAGK